MSYLKNAQTMIVLASCLTATQALSVQVSYVGSGVELVMLDPETASFECGYSDLPAQVEIDDNTLAETSISFQLPLLGFEVRPQAVADRGTEIVERRGTEKVTVRLQDDSLVVDPSPNNKEADLPTLSPDEWHIIMTAKFDVCVGLGTLQIVHGNWDAVLQVGQYETRILQSHTMPEDLVLRYQVNASGSDQLPIELLRDVTETRIRGVKQVGTTTLEDGRSLGVLSFYDRQIGLTFTSPADLDGISDDTSLSVRFMLVAAASASD